MEEQFILKNKKDTFLRKHTRKHKYRRLGVRAAFQDSPGCHGQYTEVGGNGIHLRPEILISHGKP